MRRWREMDETTRLSKSKQGYGYKYTELAQINEYLEQKGESYYQYIESVDGNDYIVTVKVKADGTESKPLRGCRIIYSNTLQGKSNEAQEMGSGITYARRYSLLMAYGLATEDDDAACMTKKKPTGRTINNPTAADVQQLAKEVAGQTGTPIDDATVGQILYLARNKNILPTDLCGYYKVGQLNQLTAEQGADCLKRLNAIKAKQ